MKNIDEVRKELSLVYAGLKAGTLKLKEASEMNNTCGKLIGTAKVQLEYYALRKEKPEIPFLNTTTT